MEQKVQRKPIDRKINQGGKKSPFENLHIIDGKTGIPRDAKHLLDRADEKGVSATTRISFLLGAARLMKKSNPLEAASCYEKAAVLLKEEELLYMARNTAHKAHLLLEENGEMKRAKTVAEKFKLVFLTQRPTTDTMVAVPA
ncbi:hypothetical protein KAW38_00340 [Candidatus Micrarchaeota archaeon]|nr:hypothetical protein [Candidatus Micrarchaeota archaeon]